MSEAVVDAINAAVTAAGVKLYDGEAGAKFDGKTEAPSGNYAVLLISPGLRDSDRETPEPSFTTIDFRISYTGTTARGTRWVARKVNDALSGRLLAGAGWVRNLASNEVKRDADRPDVTVFYGIDTFTTSTTP